jgi:hypothetical protein
MQYLAEFCFFHLGSTRGGTWNIAWRIVLLDILDFVIGDLKRAALGAANASAHAGVGVYVVSFALTFYGHTDP